uniref:LAGLIDADG homing endonuclease n=1 Tax=Fomitiporia mediterranea TaxID=208960 RepID=A0A5B9R9C8_9AGAM|nr:LAGLIDADG homing endonuclease [Fomitiporia mediterranea]QEG57081.1 LAGLIDADG homing endonuclease [Fomitiporia mediterranea]
MENLPLFGNEVFKNTFPTLLPTVGTVSTHALKKGRQLRLNKNEYLSIPYQFISYLAGLIDGVGYIQITKTTKGYIAIKLVIGLSLDDLSTLEYIHSVLKLGIITKHRDHKNPNCKLIINKTELQEVVFPLLIHHKIFFLTKTRRKQFDLAIHIFENNLKSFSNIPNVNERSSFCKLPDTALDYLNLHFFKNWLVGFTSAEGSFFIKTNNDGYFQLKQRIHVQLFEAFKLLFDTKRQISIEKDSFAQFTVSSKKDIQKVIDFFSFSGLHPLIGLKSIQYFKWLTELQNSSRYRNLNFPK